MIEVNSDKGEELVPTICEEEREKTGCRGSQIFFTELNLLTYEFYILVYFLIR